MVFVESEIEAGKFIEDFMLFHSGSSRLPAREKRLQREIIREFDLAGENDTGRKDPNHQIIDDYSYWMSNCSLRR